MAHYSSDSEGEPFYVIELGSGELQLSFSGEVIEIIEPRVVWPMRRLPMSREDLKKLYVCDC
jgi:hypothetical protein